jgi:hypothetical protein
MNDLNIYLKLSVYYNSYILLKIKNKLLKIISMNHSRATVI